MNFSLKLNQAIKKNKSLLVLALDPNLEIFSPTAEINLVAEIEKWLKSILEKSKNLVCAYKLNLAFYEVLGSDGFLLLERIFRQVDPQIPVILDAKHGDLNSSSVFAKTIFEKWKVDAVTLTPYSGQDHVAPFLVYSGQGVFMLTHTSNPGAETLQNYPSLEHPFYLHLVQEIKSWGAPEQLFFEVGTGDPEVLRRIRNIAPERTILLRSIWKNDNSLETFLSAGLNSQGGGLLIPVPLDVLLKDDLSAQLKALNERVNQFKNLQRKDGESCDLWISDVCILEKHPYQDLVLQLYDIGCLIFGDYVQASGSTFSYYIDLRKIISNPQVFNQVLNCYGKILTKLDFDRIAGIPYGSLPTATGLSMLLQKPMIFPRKEVKAHGTRKLIEGDFQVGEKVVVVDDVLISGKSALEGVAKIKSAQLIVEDIVVLIDHGENVMERIQSEGYRAHAVLKLSEITEILYLAGRLSQEQYDILRH
jgi:uridine monophosphate synthetase